ncbi:MAG: antibiotic biosynthesis monooxygenase [Actinomycetota bacterium]
MATILAHLRVRPGEEERFESIARRLHESTHAHEADVLRYEYWRGAEPGAYYTLLSFRDEHGFIAHQVSEHHEDAGAGLGEVLADIRLEWVDPVDGACGLPPTERQGPVADATERWLHYHGSMGADVQEWWRDRRGAG